MNRALTVVFGGPLLVLVAAVVYTVLVAPARAATEPPPAFEYPYRAIVTIEGEQHELPAPIAFGRLPFRQIRLGGRAYTEVTVRDASGSITGYFTMDTNELDLVAVPQP